MTPDTCPRCGREQTPGAYCTPWKETDCIRMQAAVPDALRDDDGPQDGGEAEAIGDAYAAQYD